MIRINKKTTRSKLKSLEKPELGSWIDLINPTYGEVDIVSSICNIPKDFIKSALDEDERPRFDIDEETETKLIIFRVPTQEPSTEKIEIFPLGIIITKELILTVCLREIALLKDFYDEKIKNFYTTKRTRFLIQILSRTNSYYIKYLNKIEHEIDKIEQSLLKSLKNIEIIKLFQLQKILIYFNTAVIGNANVMENILKGKIVKLFEEDEHILEDIIIENRQSIEMVTVYNNILSNTLDAYATIVSNNLNVIMKFLASLTIILAIPTMVFSLYGMNVGLPLQGHPEAFWFTLLISLFLSGLIALIFIRRKWL